MDDGKVTSVEEFGMSRYEASSQYDDQDDDEEYNRFLRNQERDKLAKIRRKNPGFKPNPVRASQKQGM